MPESDTDRAMVEMERIYFNLTERVTKLPERYLQMKVVADSVRRITELNEDKDPISGMKVLMECSFILGYIQGIRDKE